MTFTISKPEMRTGVNFRNWSGSVNTNPTAFYYPATVEEVQHIVRTLPAGETVRTVGGGHSFTPVAAGTQSMISLDKLAGIVRIDPETKRVRFLAGTRLHRIPEYLQPFGLALANQGDIDVQSVAGAISTSTHGTGIEWTGFAGTITGLSLIDADGNRREYSIDTEPDALRLVTVSLGALGVIVEVEMQCVDAFDLLAEEGADSLDAVLDSWEANSRAVDHYEAFWFPHTDRAMVKSNTRLAPGAPAPGGDPKVRGRITRFIEDDLIGNGAFASALAVARAVPKATPMLNSVAAGAMAANRYRSRAHDVFATPRRVRFHETEFAVPLENGPEAVREIRRELDRRNWLIPFPARAAHHRRRRRGSVHLHRPRIDVHRLPRAAGDELPRVFPRCPRHPQSRRRATPLGKDAHARPGGFLGDVPAFRRILRAARAHGSRP